MGNGKTGTETGVEAGNKEGTDVRYTGDENIPADRDTSTTSTGTNTRRTDTGTSGSAEAEAIEAKPPEAKPPEAKPPKVVAITPPKPRRKRTPKKSDNDSETVKQFTAFLTGLCAVIASRPNMSHWAITESEAKQIAVPLVNIINNSEALKGIAEHSDALALGVALIAVIAPRAMITVQMIDTRRPQNDRKATIPVPANRPANVPTTGNGSNQAIFDSLLATNM